MKQQLSCDPQEPLSHLLMTKSAQGTAITFPDVLPNPPMAANSTNTAEPQSCSTITLVRPPETKIEPISVRPPNRTATLFKTIRSTFEGSVNFIFDGFLKAPDAGKSRLSGSSKPAGPNIVEKSSYINDRVRAVMDKASFTPKQIEALKKSLNRL